MFRQVVAFLLILVSNNVCFGQERAWDQNEPANQLAEYAVSQMPEQIKTVDDPALRIFLRLRLASFLWSAGPDTGILSSQEAESLVMDALSELKARGDELPPLYAKQFRNDLLALIKLHAPNLAKQLDDQYVGKQDGSGKSVDIAYSMLSEKDGVAPAVEMVRRGLNNGQAPDMTILFFLSRLQNEKPAELARLLSAILDFEGRAPGGISLETFFWLHSMYLREENPPEIRVRFASMVIAIMEREDWSAGARATQAYQLINNVFPVVEKLAPSLYQRCRNLLSALWVRLPRSVAERMAVESRIKQSADKLNQTLIEANAAKDELLKEDLLTEAAQLALGKKELKMAADLAASTSSDGNHGLWRDQFLGDILDQALKEKDSSLAEYVAAKVKSASNRAFSLQKIALYFFEAKDLVRAREALNEAAKLAASNKNDAQKARLLLGLTASFIKVDEIRVTEMIQSAINVINHIPQPRPEDKPNSNARREYAQSLVDVAWNILPVFRSLSVKDYIGMYSIAAGIQDKGVRLAAILGAATGILQANRRADLKAQKN
jgi:hypothetical protein